MTRNHHVMCGDDLFTYTWANILYKCTIHITSIHTDEARPWAEYSAMQFHELFQKYYFRWPCAYNKNNAPDTVGLKKDFIIHKNISKTFN